MSKSKTILWNDTDNRDSYKLCLPEYGLKLLLAKDIGPDTVEVTIYGEDEAVDAFLADLDEDSVEPLERMSISIEADEDYEGWLNNEVGVLDALALEDESNT